MIHPEKGCLTCGVSVALLWLSVYGPFGEWYVRISSAVSFVLTSFLFLQAARALANLAAHGDSNSNNAAVGQEAGALEALVQLIRSPHDGVR